MSDDIFYTYAQTYKSRVFFRGYKGDKRFNIVYGGLPFTNNDNFMDPNNPRYSLYLQNKKFALHRVSSYIRKDEYNARKNYINSILCYGTSIYGTKINCEINENCNKKDIFNNEMVEIRYPINQDDLVRKTLANDYINIYNDIQPDVKVMEIFQRRPDFKVNFNKIKVGFIDIEIEQEKGGPLSADVANERINVITLKIKNGKIYTFCLGEFKTNDPNIEVYCFDKEYDLLNKFIDVWQQLDIDIISDWNGLSFDIPYIINRCRKIVGYTRTNDLSPFKYIETRKRKNKFGKEFFTYNIIGITHLDYMELYITFSWTPRESYSLNNICQAEIGKGKLNYDEYGNLKRLYNQNFQKFVEYNIRDVTILEELDEKMNLISLANHIAYKCHCSSEEVASPIKTWDNYIYSNFAKKNLVIPPRRNIEKAESLMGGYVKLPRTGLYNWVVSFDVNSLYPTIIRQLNLSPETFTDKVDTRFEALSPYDEDSDPHRIGALIDCIYDTSYLKKENLCLTCNGNLIKKDKQGFLPEMVGDLYNNRVEVKGKMKKAQRDLEVLIKEHPADFDIREKELKTLISTYKNEQLAIKVLMNALYGQLGNKYCRWYDIRIPRSITKTGQTLIRYIARKMNELLNKECETNGFDYVIAIDTDSNYLNLENLVKKKGYKTVDELNVYIENVLEPYIDKSFREFYDYMNHFDFQMKMKREAISDRGIFINKKKRYCLSVIDMEGVRYAEPHLKIMGLEVIKSSTPEGVREQLTQVLKILLYSDKYELVQYIDKFREQFKTLPPHLIAINKKVSEINKWEETLYDKNGRKLGVPINTKAAMNYNRMLNLHPEVKLPKIEGGDKIKYVYMKENPYGYDVLGFVDYLPKEFGLDKYIDYDKQFEKVFLENVKNITDDFNYNLDTEYTIEDLL